MAARHYDGQYRAQGETAFHSDRKSAQNAIAKMRRTIKIWQRFAEAPAGPTAVDRAQREIAALEWHIGLQERIVREADAAIAEREERLREGAGV